MNPAFSNVRMSRAAILKSFQLREEPFGVTPDPKFLYLSHTHREALASIVHGIEAGRGFMALVAEPGMGKTTVLFEILGQCRDWAQTALVFHTQCDSRELLRYVLADTGLDSRETDLVRIHQQFHDLLLRTSRAGKKFIIVIDEAHNLKDEVLETVRLLSNFETPSTKLLQIILAGQPQLAAQLANPRLSQLRQRISMLCKLAPLSVPEVDAYISHRLQVAGHRGAPLFSKPAIEFIAERGNGIPRNINNYCFNALSLAYALERRQVDLEAVREVARDLELNPDAEVPEWQSIPSAAPGQQTAAAPDHRHDIAPEAAPRFQPVTVLPEAVTLPLPESPGEQQKPAAVAMSSKAAAATAPASAPSIPLGRTRRPAPAGESPAAKPLQFDTALSHRKAESVFSLYQSRSQAVWIAAMLLLFALAAGLLWWSGVPESNVRAAAATSPIAPSASPIKPVPGQVKAAKKVVPARPEPPGKKTSRSRAAVAVTVRSTQVQLRHLANKRLPAAGQPRATLGPAEPPPPGLVRGGISRRVLPTYPEAAETASIDGAVVLDAVIERNGSIGEIRVLSGHPFLAAAAIQAVRQWRYNPSYLNGEPVALETRITVDFRR